VHNKSDVSTRLVEATIRVIETEGEVGVRLHDLSREVGVAISAVYNYFGSRDGLIVAAHAERYIRSAVDLTEWYVDAVSQCESADDFRSLIDKTVVVVSDPSRASRRLARASVIGSSVGRPDLIKAILELDRNQVKVLGDCLEHAKQKGWVRADLDSEAAVLWWFGIVNARVAVELGPTVISEERWDFMFREAAHFLFFGEAPKK
jgi:AcrR family transcriptional regulator